MDYFELKVIKRRKHKKKNSLPFPCLPQRQVRLLYQAAAKECRMIEEKRSFSSPTKTCRDPQHLVIWAEA